MNAQLPVPQRPTKLLERVQEAIRPPQRLLQEAPWQPYQGDDFHPEIVEIDRRPQPRAVAIATWTVLCLVALLFTWAALADLDRVVEADGKVVSNARQIHVQPFRTSIVGHVPVRAGEVVTRGALLAELDATFSEADRKQLEVLVLSLAAEIERLRAELSGEAYKPSVENEYTQLQLRIADQRRAEREAKVAELDMKIAEAEAGERATTEKLRFLHTQQNALETLRSGRQELLARGVASQAQYLDLVQQEAKIRGEVAEAEGEQKRFAKQREQATAERASFLATWAVEGQQRLVSAEREYIQKAQELEKALKVKDLDVVTAATDAVVLEVAQRSGGSVLNNGETLMTLVPIDGALEVEAEVLSRDIGWIKVGQEARLKLDTLPFHRHGLLYGRVRALSPDGLPKQNPSSSQRADLRSESGADVWVHRVYITIERDDLRNRPEAFRLLPGMTVRAELIVGNRTVLSYLIDPLMEGLDRSLKEPR